jgi:hypothetical protein
MRLQLASILILVAAACGDDGGNATETGDTSAGPSTGSEDSSSGGSLDSESSGGSSGGSTDSGSTSGVDSGSTESGGSTGDSGGSSETGGGAFACGDDLECDLATQYCQRQISDVVGEPDGYQCVALPEGCGGVNSCDCLADAQCGEFDLCEMTPEGGSILSCPGG